jgi:hypothetical protein
LSQVSSSSLASLQAGLFLERKFHLPGHRTGVPELPAGFPAWELPLERKQLPQFVDIRHIGIESMERLEPVKVLRNQQVAGSILQVAPK